MKEHIQIHLLIICLLPCLSVRSLLAVTNSPVLPSPDAKQTGAKAIVAQSTVPEREITLASFLKVLDQKAAARSVAKTSAQKEEVQKQLQQFVDAALEASHMTITVAVTDVRVPHDGEAEIHYRAPDLTQSIPKGLQNIRIQFRGRATINLSRDQALRINPGTTMKISGKPVFTPSRDVVSDAFASTRSIVTLSVQGFAASLGFLDFTARQYEITGM